MVTLQEEAPSSEQKNLLKVKKGLLWTHPSHHPHMVRLLTFSSLKVKPKNRDYALKWGTEKF